MPFFSGASHNTVWVGATLLGNRLITLDGDDVSNTYLGLMSRESKNKGECVAANLRNGIILHGVNCSCESDFVCEVNLKSEDKVVNKKVLKYIFDEH